MTSCEVRGKQDYSIHPPPQDVLSVGDIQADGNKAFMIVRGKKRAIRTA